MNRIDVKELVQDNVSFKLNKARTLFKLEKVLAKCGRPSKVPFILFVDDEDKASCKYVKYKLLDIEKSRIDGIPITFTDLYNVEGSIRDTQLFKTLNCIMEKYNTTDIPFIVQIPSDPKRFKEFENKGIYGLILDSIILIKNKANNFNEPVDVDFFKNKENNSFVYDISLDRICRSALSDSETLDTILSESRIPATPKGILTLINYMIPKLNLKRGKVNFSGLKVAIVGCNSKTTGIYLTEILLKLKATVSLYHSKSVIDKDEFKDYDVVISCAGVPKLLTLNEIGVSEFDRILIDVGVSVGKDGKVIGDFSECIRVSKNHYTPYVNGVGLLTRAALLNNIMLTYDHILNKDEVE